MLPLGRDKRWIFVGDSITDCGRRTDSKGRLGNGYVRIIHDWLLARSPGDAPTIINRGVDGDCITDVAKRWQTDVIDAAPDVVSFKIGVNDVWRQLDKPKAGTKLTDFVRMYEDLLAQLVKARPGVRLVLVEPSVISLPASAKGNGMILPYAMAIREIASMFKEHVECTVPLHGVCVEAEDLRQDINWWADGVHPEPVGHMLFARTWLSETRLL